MPGFLILSIGLLVQDPGAGAAIDHEAYLRQALTLQSEEDGRVVLRCSIGADRRYTDCEVVGENPVGEGFGEAALRIATERLAAHAPDDLPVGQRVTFTMPFILED